jgi:spermidine/putrescine transport system substrate-binding protein
VTLPIYDEVPLIESNLQPEGGPLRIYNWADYVSPDVIKAFEKKYKTRVEITTFASMDQAIAKLTGSEQSFDVFFATIDRVAPLVASKLLRPLNHDYLPNLAANVWPELQSPYYDQESRYTVPYTVYTTGIGWRADKVKDDVAAAGWDSLWQFGPERPGKVGVLDDSRDALYLGMLHAGVGEDPNTEDPEHITAALAALQELSDTSRVKVSGSVYQLLPEGGVHLSQDWSGDLLSSVLFYRPKGVPPEAIAYWTPETAAPCANDMLTIMSGGKNPVLAHLFLNFMLDEKQAYDNFALYNGYQVPQVTIEPAALQSKLGLPDSAVRAIVTPEQFATAVTILPLTPDGQAAWDQAWKTFSAG